MPDLKYEDHLTHIQTLIDATLKAADPVRQLSANWPMSINEDGPAYLVGAGKASLEMALQVENLFTGDLKGGAVAVVPERLARLSETPRHFTAYPAAHPLPDERNVIAAQAIAEVARKADTGDKLIVLLSGGGSAHLTLPAGELTFEDVRVITGALQRAGAPIGQLNTVRKHIEQLKGGGLARLAVPARVWTFILSDVIGDSLHEIASGPTAADPTTYEDALSLLHDYRLMDVSPRVVAHLEAGARGDIAETIKPGDDSFQYVTNLLIGSNRQGLIRARQEAQKEGWQVVGFELGVEGEARLTGMRLGWLSHHLAERPDRPCCWIVGSETTVTVHGSGKGGRNQELALSAAISMDGVENIALAAFATDGVDGASDAAGAIVTGHTCAAGRALGMDPQEYLNNNDSNTFFKRVGGLIETGPTGTNINDIAFLLAYD